MGMLAKIGRKLGLRRRYGHATMASFKETTKGIREIAQENAPVTAAVVGATGGAVAGAMGVGTGALIGGVAGVAIQQATKK